MGLVILAVLIGVPLIEIGLFIEIGAAIGFWPTLLGVIFTALAGAAMLRHQGIATLNKMRTSLDSGEAPLASVFDGFCLLAAGILLLTPGFFTDTLGFLLFIPPLRTMMLVQFAKRVQIKTHPPQAGPDDIIEGDWHEVNPPDSKKIE